MDDSDSTDPAKAEQGTPVYGFIQARMLASQVEELQVAAREEGVPNTTELVRRVMLSFARSSEFRAFYHTLPQGLLHPNPTIAFGSVEER